MLATRTVTQHSERPSNVEEHGRFFYTGNACEFCCLIYAHRDEGGFPTQVSVLLVMGAGLFMRYITDMVPETIFLGWL